MVALVLATHDYHVSDLQQKISTTMPVICIRACIVFSVVFIEMQNVHVNHCAVMDFVARRMQSVAVAS